MKTFKIISTHILLLSIFIIPVFISAQTPVNPPPTTNITVSIPNPLRDNTSSLIGLITIILNDVVMPIAAVAVVVWIVWAGFSFVTAQGKPEKIKEAKSRLLWSLIGAGILLGASAISAVVRRTIEGLTSN